MVTKKKGNHRSWASSKHSVSKSSVSNCSGSKVHVSKNNIKQATDSCQSAM